jgi:L-fuconate dehydratase
VRCTITRVEVADRRFPLHAGAGSDAVHAVTEYAYAVTRLLTDGSETGCGLTLTLGRGNEVVCQIIPLLAQSLVGLEIEEIMNGFGDLTRQLADHPELRWLGPHKGAVALAQASIVNACFDLWSKSRGAPLWRLLLDLQPSQVVALLDLSYLEETLTRDDALAMLNAHHATRAQRENVLAAGYPGYDTSVGWFQYGDSDVQERARRALDHGFRAFKLKVGSTDGERDIRRATMLRNVVGNQCLVMLDANQQWNFPQARRMCEALRPIDPYWIEEPTHPDDLLAHQVLAREMLPGRLALGEHLANRVAFKNFMQAGAVHFVQADCTRLAGVSEFLAVSLLARKFGLPIVPHVGDMGQIHQHLVLFNHIALGHDLQSLEYIPHLREYFLHPARVEGGIYRTPQEPGSSQELK